MVILNPQSIISTIKPIARLIGQLRRVSLAFTAPDEGEFCLTEILGNKIITLLSCPISLAIGFLFYSTLLILIYTKIRLHLATVCPSGPCIELPDLISTIAIVTLNHQSTMSTIAIVFSITNRELIPLLNDMASHRVRIKNGTSPNSTLCISRFGQPRAFAF